MVHYSLTQSIPEKCLVAAACAQWPGDILHLMRLTSQQIATIRQVVAEQLGSGARVLLFGSRVDDAARGGDIDLLVETKRELANRSAEASRLAAKLQLALGDQRIDVLIIDPTTRLQPIHRAAKETGVAL